MVGLIAPHGIFAGLIPRPCRRAAQVVLANESCLDRLSALPINFLLAPYGPLPPRIGVLRFAVVGSGGGG